MLLKEYRQKKEQTNMHEAMRCYRKQIIEHAKSFQECLINEKMEKLGSNPEKVSMQKEIEQEVEVILKLIPREIID